MLLLRALFLRPARMRPLRLLATVLGVAAGVAALISTRVSSRAAVDALSEGVVTLAGPARLEIVRDGGVGIETLGLLAPVADEAIALPVVDEIVLSPKLGDTLRLFGVDPASDVASDRFDLAPRDEGGAASPSASAAAASAFQQGLDCRGVWLSRTLAVELGVATGGHFEIQVRARSVELDVLGFFTPRVGGAAARAFDRVVLLDVACAQELVGRTTRVDRIELVPRRVAGNATDEKAATARLKKRVEALLPVGTRVQEPEVRATAIRGLARALEFDLGVMALISLFVGGVLVAISLATSVVQRKEVLAVCVSLGASRAQLAWALACEALAIGLAGGALGALAGYGAARLAAPGVRATLANVVGQAPPGTVDLRASDVVFGIALGGACALVSALLPIFEARRTPPVQNLRRESPSSMRGRARAWSLGTTAGLVAFAFVSTLLPPWHDLPIAALSGTFALQAALFFVLGPLFELVGHVGARASAHSRAGAILRLALSALSAGRRRAVWAAGAVGIAVSLSVAIATMIGSFRETIVDWTGRAFTADYWIKPLPSALGGAVGRLDPELVDLAIEQFGRASVDPFHSGRARVDGQDVQLTAAEFEVVATRGIMTFLGGLSPKDVYRTAFERHQVIVSQALALRFGLDAGDTVRFEVAGRSLEKRIAGVCRDYGDSQGQIILDRPEYLELLPGDAPQQIAVFLPAGTDRAAARARFLAALDPGARVEMIAVADLRRNILEVFERTFAITRGMQAVAAAVAVIAVLTVLFALLSERRGEVGILRALGASNAQVAVSIGLQAGLLGAIGALAGTAAGIAIGWIIVDVVQPQSFRWTLDFHVPWWDTLELLFGVSVVCAAAGLWPALVAARWSPRELLREEE